MEYLKAVILGVVQGATEFLPISSSGHLSLFQHFMGLSGEGSLMLSVFLHIGTLVAVLAVYWRTFLKLLKEMGLFLKDLFTLKLFKTETTHDRHMLYMYVISCVPLLLLIAPVGGGYQVKDYVEAFTQDSDILLEGVCFLITAILLFTGVARSRKNQNPKARVGAGAAIWVGIAQFFAACLPGISRSGSTISTGMLCGVDKDHMVEYSFVLGTPAVMAASLLEIKDAMDVGFDTLSYGPLAAGIITATVVGIAAIKLLQWLVNKDKFQFFAYYCLILAAFTIVVATYEYLTGSLLQF